MAQKKTWIVKWMPDGDDLRNGCQYFKGDTNKAYTSFEAAEERCMQVASESRREVGVFELVAVYRPPLDVESVPIEGEGKATTKATRRKRHAH